MKKKGDNFFWPSFADLMTSLFFIVLVLYVLTFALLKRKEKELQVKVQDLDRKLKIFTLVEENLKPLKHEPALFRYEEAYKRFTLAFDVKFNTNKYNILEDSHLLNPMETRKKISEAGFKLQYIIDNLIRAKNENPNLKNVSYILAISGYASRTGEEAANYELSYHRALTLWDYWRSIGINFEAPEYRELIDLQIAGNGWGGVGRLKNEEANQRFLIQIFPKIGDIKK